MILKEAHKELTNHYLWSETTSLEDLLTDSFVSKHTDCSNFNELLDCCNIEFSNQEEFENLDVTIFDKMIREHSNLQSWVEFVQLAVDNRQSRL